MYILQCQLHSNLSCKRNPSIIIYTPRHIHDYSMVSMRFLEKKKQLFIHESVRKVPNHQVLLHKKMEIGKETETPKKLEQR